MHVRRAAVDKTPINGNNVRGPGSGGMSAPLSPSPGGGGGGGGGGVPAPPPFEDLLGRDAQVPLDSPFGEALKAQEEVVDRRAELPRFGPNHYIHRTRPGEITREHEQYLLTYAMSVGIRHVVTVWQNKGMSAEQQRARESRHKTLQDVDVQEMKEGVLREHFGRTYKFYFPPEGGKPSQDPLRVTPPHKLKAGFKFKDYAPEVFARLRKRFGIDDVDYLLSLCGTFNFIEFVSNSKSGEFFFYSHDGRFLIKTQRKSESKFMRESLPKYFEYVADHPRTMLVRLCGAHRVKIPSIQRKIHFVIMMSVFAEATEAHPVNRIYDLKGATVGRLAKEGENVKKDLDIVKDGKKFHLGARKGDFVDQIKSDAMFLCSLGVMDYSLLVGIQERDPPQTAGSFVFRSNRKASLMHPSGLARTTSAESGSMVLGNKTASLDKMSVDGSSPGTAATSAAGGGATAATTTRQLRTTSSNNNDPNASPRSSNMAQKRPGLPRVFSSNQQMHPAAAAIAAGMDEELIADVNPVPEEDEVASALNGDFTTATSSINKPGSNSSKKSNHSRVPSHEFNSFYKLVSSSVLLPEVYHVGIIDIFTRYSGRKRTEHFLKSMYFDGSQISSVDPQHYANRFVAFIAGIVE